MHDLRMVPPALAAWGAAAWLVTLSSYASVIVAIAAVIAAGVLTRWHPRGRLVWLLTAVCLVAISASCAWRLTTIEHSPLTDLAQHHRLATLDLEVRRDARTFTHHGHESVVVEVLVRRAVSRDVDIRTRDHATAFLDGDARGLVVGRRFTAIGRLAPSDASDEAAVIDVVRRGSADRATWWWEA